MKLTSENENKPEANQGGKPGENKPGWLGHFTRGANKDKPAEGNNFKKGKEAIADYHTKLKDEKSKREKITQYTKVERGGEKKTPEEVEDGREAILNKFVGSGKKWQAPKLVTTNLIKGEVTTFVSWRKNIILLSISLVLIIALVVLAYGGLIFWEKQASAEGERLLLEIKLIEQRIKQVEIEVVEIDIFQERLSLVDSLVNKHIYWTNVFKFFEDNIMSDVYITSDFSSDLSGIYSFPIEGNSYADITNFANVLRNSEEVLEVSIKSGSMGPAGGGETGTKVNFTVEFKLDPSIYTK